MKRYLIIYRPKKCLSKWAHAHFDLESSNIVIEAKSKKQATLEWKAISMMRRLYTIESITAIRGEVCVEEQKN